MKKYLLIFICSLITLYAQAQDSTKVSQKLSKQFTKEAEPERMTWEVGTDVYPLLSGYTQWQSIFVRKNITKVKGLSEMYRAYRFRIGLHSDNNSVDTLNSTTSGVRAQSFNPFLILGYEYQQQMGKWQLFYGSDVRLSYSYGNYENPNPYYNSSTSSYLIGVKYNKRTSYNLALLPFVGMKYFIHPRFAISLESNFWISYSSYYESIKIVTGKIIIEQNSTTNNVSTEINSISVLNLSYLF